MDTFLGRKVHYTQLGLFWLMLFEYLAVKTHEKEHLRRDFLMTRSVFGLNVSVVSIFTTCFGRKSIKLR